MAVIGDLTVVVIGCLMAVCGESMTAIGDSMIVCDDSMIVGGGWMLVSGVILDNPRPPEDRVMRFADIRQICPMEQTKTPSMAQSHRI